MSRQDVLRFLRTHAGTFLSGEELSRQLGLSRAAVWKAVDALRREGYTIEARTGLGYRLAGTPDVLTEAEIRGYLGKTEIVGNTLYCLDQVDSTNTYAKQLGMAGAPDGTVVVADSQTAGRGRMDRRFESPAGQGIYLTALLRPGIPPQRLMPVTALAGVAVCQAVEEVCGVRPLLKWPNDPVLHGRKLSGILTELSLEAEAGRMQYLVVGIGLNVGQTAEDFPSDLQKVATSLYQELGRNVSRPALAAAEIRALDRLYAALRTGDLQAYLETYRRDCVNLGRTVRIQGPSGEETAQAIGIDEEFGLVVEDGTGERRTIRSGEVSVRGLYGYV